MHYDVHYWQWNVHFAAENVMKPGQPRALKIMKYKLWKTVNFKITKRQEMKYKKVLLAKL